MSSNTKPLIAVTGATGAQGGSVVRFLLDAGGFNIRAITRNVDSPASQALKDKGVEVVKADMNDVESLKKAFDGAYGVFGVTNYWDPSVMDEEKEFLHGKAQVDAAKAAGVKHFVFSTLENIPGVHHAISKARANDYLIQSGIPRTSIYTAYYYENHVNMEPMKLKKEADGSLVAQWDILKTDGVLPGYAVADTGAFVVAALKDPKTWIGKDIKIISELFTPRKLVAAIEEIGGVKIKLKEVDDAAFDALKDVPQLKELHRNMNAFYETGGTVGRTSEEVEIAKKLYPQQQTVRDFVKANLDKLIPN